MSKSHPTKTITIVPARFRRSLQSRVAELCGVSFSRMLYRDPANHKFSVSAIPLQTNREALHCVILIGCAGDVVALGGRSVGVLRRSMGALSSTVRHPLIDPEIRKEENRQYIIRVIAPTGFASPLKHSLIPWTSEMRYLA